MFFAILLTALPTLGACSSDAGVDGTALPPSASGTETPTTAPTAETYGPITVSARTAFVGVNYEPDPSFDENMDAPSRLGVETVVAGPDGSELTITVYSLDGYVYAGRPVVPAAGTVLRYVTVAWQMGELAEDDEDTAGSVVLVRDDLQLAEPGLLELDPQPASRQELPTSMYGYIAAIAPEIDGAAVEYTLTTAGDTRSGSVLLLDGSTR